MVVGGSSVVVMVDNVVVVPVVNAVAVCEEVDAVMRRDSDTSGLPMTHTGRSDVPLEMDRQTDRHCGEQHATRGLR